MPLTPVVIEQTSKGERSYDIFSRLLKDRIIMLDGAIDERVSSVLCAQLLFLESQDAKKDITLYVNSPGGLVTAGMAIYDTMQYISADIQTVVTGQACSMGSLLASAGTRGKRLMLPHSRHMIHQPLGGASTNCYVGNANSQKCMCRTQARHSKNCLLTWSETSS